VRPRRDGDVRDWEVADVVAGMLAEDQGEVDRALGDYRAALDHARQIAYRWGIAIALNRLGALTPDSAEAAVCFRASLGHCVATHQLFHAASALEGLATTLIVEDAPRAARCDRVAGRALWAGATCCYPRSGPRLQRVGGLSMWNREGAGSLGRSVASADLFGAIVRRTMWSVGLAIVTPIGREFGARGL
jgi:hypothetical protein